MSDPTHLFVFWREEGRMPDVWRGDESAVEAWASEAHEHRSVFDRLSDQRVPVVRWCTAQMLRIGWTGR